MIVPNTNIIHDHAFHKLMHRSGGNCELCVTVPSWQLVLDWPTKSKQV